VLYVVAFLLACFAWLGWRAPLNRAAAAALLVGLVAHTFGVGARMYIDGRPPVTNLYASAVFVGWVAVVVGIVLEALFRRGFGTLVADSRPPGARVVLDGKVIGKTPIKLGNVKAGAHTVRLEIDGYRVWSTDVKVVAGRDTRVTGSLDRMRNP